MMNNQINATVPASEQQGAIPLETPLTVTLTAAQWQWLMNLLWESGPARLVMPVLQEVQKQTAEAARAVAVTH